MKLGLVTICVLALWPSTLSAADRVPWTTSRIVGSPEPPKPYHVERVYPHLNFDQPVELMPLGNTGKMMLLEVTGKLYTFDDDPECREAELAIDFHPLMDDFRRAFGFSVHPNFAKNRQIFVAYADDGDARGDGTRLSRFVVTGDSSPRVDPASEEILLTWPSGGHNGCAIRFDSRGLLYFSTGDGARPYPPDEYDVSQDLSDLRSTICRIDVDRREADRPYSIPGDNPFLDTPQARPEIWAYGFRNPWRFTIVPETDQLLCGDVGWELWELVFDVRRGSNCGWSIFEGPQPIRSDIKPGPTPIEKPLVAYPHAVGQSVTGGVVYRGSEHEDLRGVYFYGDYVTGLLWGLRYEQDQVTWNPVLAETGLRIITFAESRDGEVLLVDFDGGIYKLVKNPVADQPSQFPRKLSETGLFSSTPALEPAPGVLRYNVSAPAWQDGAASDFVIAVPGYETIIINQRQRSWQYPEGTVFAKTLSNGSLPIETQILHFNGIDWHPYSYVWNDDHADADLVGEAGLTKELSSADESSAEISAWQIHNRAQCRACHSRQNGGAVGFTLENIDCQDQIDRFIDLGILNRAAPKQWNVSSMVDPFDSSAGLERRARSYLTANCAHCHRRGGGGTVGLDLSFSIPNDQINAIDVAATQGTFGIENAKVIDPGDPCRSVLFFRMATSATGHMPKIWTRDNDAPGLQLVHDWIVSLDHHGESRIHPIDSAAALGDTSSALRLFANLLFDGGDEADRLRVATRAVHSGSAMTAGLFERFLPPDQRRQRLGNDINAAEILAIQGDVQRGREWFFSAQTGQCIHCHRLQGSGRSVGPDLDGIAKKRTREQLLESIVDPSKAIEPQFTSYLVLKDDGSIVTGLKIAETAATVTLRVAEGKDIRILKAEIESLNMQSQSLMPTGLAAEMTAGELADLVEFLASLK